MGRKLGVKEQVEKLSRKIRILFHTYFVLFFFFFSYWIRRMNGTSQPSKKQWKELSLTWQNERWTNHNLPCECSNITTIFFFSYFLCCYYYYFNEIYRLVISGYIVLFVFIMYFFFFFCLLYLGFRVASFVLNIYY